MDNRKQAIFRMAFRMHTLQRYHLVDDAPGSTPDVAIVDLDGAEGRALWDRFRAEYPHLPALIATVGTIPDAPAPLLVKPIRVEVLFPLLRQVLDRQACAAKAPVPPAMESPRKPLPVPETDDPAVAEPLPGQPITKPAAHQLPEIIERFNPGQGLMGVLGEIRRHRTPSVVHIAERAALIALPNQERALLLWDMAELATACASPGITVSARPLTAADRPKGAKPHSFTGLLWQVALWTSRGRLIEGIHVHTPLHLRHWPNLTRLAPTPEAMRIAALWTRSPVSLWLTVRMLNVPPQHIFDFIAASYGIGILELPEVNPETLVPMNPAPTTSSQPQTEKERGGLLSRLLRKVVGL
jgi:hypothetical protein